MVSFALGAVLPRRGPAQNGPGGVAADVDSFIAIHADGSVTIYTSKVDVGTGLATAFRQIAAEELGIPVERFSVVEGDTATTPNHGGTGGSSGIPRGAADIRRAAATARQALLELGAKQLNRPAAELTIAAGEVRPVNGGQGIAVAASDRRQALFAQGRSEGAAQGSRHVHRGGQADPARRRAREMHRPPPVPAGFQRCPGCCTAAWSVRPRWAPGS